VEILILRSASYANAEGWGDLIHAFAEPLEDSSLDEIILLLHTTTHGPDPPRQKYVRPVSYDEVNEVPALLLSEAPNPLRTDAIRTNQWRPRVGTAMGVPPGNDQGARRRQMRIEIPEERVAHRKETEEAMPGDDHEEEINKVQVDAARVIQDAYHRDLERKRAGAARKIQVAYRRHLKGKAVVREGIDAIQARYWHLLRKRSMKMEWPKDSRYYLLFRVPLAYILVCLDTIGAFVESEKKEAKKRMITEDHGGLEQLTEALNRYRCDSVDYTLYQGSNNPFSKLLKKTIALQKKLSPSSKFHEGQSVSDLRDAVLEAEAVVESLDDIPGSTGTRNQIKVRWDRGRKWILEK